jgi:hypothetical protein
MKKPSSNPDIIKIVEQKRHLALLNKVQQGKSLSDREISELKRFEGRSDKDPHEACVNSLDKLADVFDVSRQTVYRWKKEGMPQQENEWWNIGAVYKWVAERNSKKDKESGFKLQIDELKFRLLQLNYDERRGALISRDQVKDDLGNEILIIKQHFLSLPRQLAPQLFGLEIVEIEKALEKKIKEIISRFAKGKY